MAKDAKRSPKRNNKREAADAADVSGPTSAPSASTDRHKDDNLAMNIFRQMAKIRWPMAPDGK